MRHIEPCMVALVCCLFAYMPIRQAQRVKTTLNRKHSAEGKKCKICYVRSVHLKVKQSTTLSQNHTQRTGAVVRAGYNNTYTLRTPYLQYTNILMICATSSKVQRF